MGQAKEGNEGLTEKDNSRTVKCGTRGVERESAAVNKKKGR